MTDNANVSPVDTMKRILGEIGNKEVTSEVTLALTQKLLQQLLKQNNFSQWQLIRNYRIRELIDTFAGDENLSGLDSNYFLQHSYSEDGARIMLKREETEVTFVINKGIQGAEGVIVSMYGDDGFGSTNHLCIMSIGGEVAILTPVCV